MIEGFQNPGLAIGAALCVVPLIIHLLNRQRHRPQPWAAMRFVLAAYRKTRRRVQLENLLLLLARMLAVAALALAIARPFASGDSPLAGLREERRDLVLVIDGSASMGLRGEVESLFTGVLERAGALLEDLDGPRGDRARIVFAGARPRAFPVTDPEDARTILETLDQPLDEGCDLAAALGVVADELEDDRAAGMLGAVEVRVLTDLQAETFFDRRSTALGGEGVDGATDGPAAPPALAEQVARFDALDLKVIVEDLGPRALRPANLAVSNLEVLGDQPRAGVPFDVAVEVANHGDDDVLAERVALSVGGERMPSQRIDVPGRGSAEAVFTVVLDVPGHHALEASLEGDRLAVDDRRALVVLAPRPLEVLLVNGDPAERIEDDELGYFGAVLEPPDDGLGGGAAQGPFALTDLTAAELDATDSPIERADVIVLANVPPLAEAVAKRLEERVAAGAGLLVALGDRVGEPTAWARHLWREDGTGLLPARPTRLVTSVRRSGYHRVSAFELTHPALRYFDDERRRPLLTEVPVYDFVAARGLAPGARSIASLDDAAGSPLMVERPYGEGRVVLFTSTLDHAWNRLPDSGKTFVPLVLELVQHLGARRPEPRNVAVGEGVTVTVDAFPRNAQLILPGGAQRPLEGDPEERDDRRWDLPPIEGAQLDRAGVYTVRAEELVPAPIAVVLDARESDLARATAAEVEAIHPALVVARPGDGEDAPVDTGGGPAQGELWRWLALGALAFLTFESLWGAYIGNRRRAV